MEGELLRSERQSFGEEHQSEQEQDNAHSSTTTQTEPCCALSKNKTRKLRHAQHTLQHVKSTKRARERASRKCKGLSNGRGNDEKLAEREKLKSALSTGARRVVIDCQYQDRMSYKEKTRFAQQIRRVYGSNRKSDEPLSLVLANLSTDSELYRVCCAQNDGFENYVILVSENSVGELFGDGNDEDQQVVYLSPDAEDVISIERGFEPDKVYVIGGLVDETTSKAVSFDVATNHLNVKCVRLPIDEFFCYSGSGTGKRVLAINQVVDIVLEWYRSYNWVQALSKGLPQRTGFTPLQKHSQCD